MSVVPAPTGTGEEVCLPYLRRLVLYHQERSVAYDVSSSRAGHRLELC